MALAVHDSVLDMIGGTPIVRLRNLSPAGGGEVWAKLEYFNPGGSLKDRTALGMILEAEQRGVLKRGAVLIEPTAGNTGIGLALVGIQRGYKVVCVMLEKFSVEKQLIVKALGGEVVLVPTAEGMTRAIQLAHELAARTPGGVVLHQFENPGNPDYHQATTAEEIWEQTEGRLAAVVVAAGTGGSFTGVARLMKERAPDVQRVLVEPVGSIFGGGAPAPHIVEGIGNSSFIPRTLELALATRIVTVSDTDSLATVLALARQEGLLVGGSAGAAVWGALEVARACRPGERVVTILPDAFERYASKRYLPLE